jgi:hypothetical protein
MILLDFCANLVLFRNFAAELYLPFGIKLFRDRCLHCEWFSSLLDAQAVLQIGVCTIIPSDQNPTRPVVHSGWIQKPKQVTSPKSSEKWF